MKQLFSALLTVVFVLQPLFGQTSKDQTTSKAAPETPAEIVPIEDLLPADTLAYIASSNLAGLQHSFQLLDAYKVAHARLPKEELETGDNPLKVVSRFLSFGIEDTRALEGARVGVALIVPALPEETEAVKTAKTETSNSRSRLPEPLILLFLEGTRIEDARRAREQLLAYYNENFQPIGKSSEIKQANYKGMKLDRFKDGQVGVWFGATYVLSQQAAIDRLLNLRDDRRAERLADDQEFLRTRTQMMPQTGLFAYLNGKPLDNMLNSLLGRVGSGGMGLGAMDSVMSFMMGAAAIKSVALASTFDREGVVDRLVLNLDPAKKNLLTTFFSGSKGEFKATPLIPAGTETLVSHSLDWVKLYDDFFVKTVYGMMAQQELMRKYNAEMEAKRKESEANKQKPPENNWEELSKRMATEMTEEKLSKAIKEQEAKMDTELGFVLRDEIVKDLGNEITIAYGIPKLIAAAADSEGKKKDNEGWAVFIGVKDRAATQQALIKTFAYFTSGMMNARGQNDEQKDVPLKTEEQLKQERELRNKNAQSAWTMMPTEIYKKVEIKSIFAAHVAFSDDYMLVADSKETIKQMLDLSDGGRSLASDFNYSRAMGGIGTATTKVFIGPKMFDGLLNDFIKSWVAKPNELDTDPQAKAPLNVPATIAATIDAEAGSIKLEAFSPLGIAGTLALWGFGSDVKSGTERKENDARYKLRQLAKAEKMYANKHSNRYATVETLAKIKDVAFNAESLKDEQNNYRFEFKLKPNAKGYEATATPIKYGRLGRLSFFIDESGQMRAADKQGAPATMADSEDSGPANNDNDDEEETPETAERAAQDASKVKGTVPPPPRPIRREQ